MSMRIQVKQPLLSVKNLNCQRGFVQLFSALNFTLNSGDTLRIAGENGKGKTSLLRLIAGLSLLDQGQILLSNTAISNGADYQKNLIYLGHLDALNLSLSALDNLVFLVNLKQNCTQQATKKALDKIGLKHYHDEPCSNLSAGQKRRVLLASLLLLDCPLWLLDEPFTALDAQGVALVEQLILKHTQQGGACIFTSHQDTILNQQQVLEL